MDAEYIRAVVKYANCVVRLLEECENEDFVDSVINAIASADKLALGELFTFADSEG